MMKDSVNCKSKVVLIFLLLLPMAMHARRIGKLNPLISQKTKQPQPQNGKGDSTMKPNLNRVDRRPPLMHKKTDPMEVAGSSLPDCTHACGSCTPCRLVMVSFVCSSTEEAETCPMAYKCMCHNKSYPVP